MKTYAEATPEEQAAYRFRRSAYPHWTAEYPADTPADPSMAAVEIVRAVQITCPFCREASLIDLKDYGDCVEIANYGEWACTACGKFHGLPETLPDAAPSTDRPAVLAALGTRDRIAELRGGKGSD